MLALDTVSEQDLYIALDWLLSQQSRIERRLAQRHLSRGTLVLYDVSSTWLEGRSCPLARRGYSRDGKRDKLQIVFGLLCASDGCPADATRSYALADTDREAASGFDSR